MEITSIIVKPKITEKTQNLRGFSNPKMTFYVNPKSNKNQISSAFRSLFGVKPSSINIVNRKPTPTRMTSRSRKNFSKATKIAYVTISSKDLESLQEKMGNGGDMGSVQEALDAELNKDKKE